MGTNSVKVKLSLDLTKYYAMKTKVNVKIKLSLCSEHHAMKASWGMEVYLLPSRSAFLSWPSFLPVFRLKFCVHFSSLHTPPMSSPLIRSP